MVNPSGTSNFQLLFDSALQDYEKQTGTVLASHPLARDLENCDSAESVTALLQKQAPDPSKSRGDHGKVMTSLKRAVHVLYTLSVSTALGESVGLVCRVVGIHVGYFRFLASRTDVMRVNPALSPRKGNIRWSCHPTFRARLCYSLHIFLCDVRVYQTVEDISNDALADLLESIDLFLTRLDIYTKVPLTTAMAEILVKIMVELLSAIALLTKQVKKKRPGESILPCRCDHFKVD